MIPRRIARVFRLRRIKDIRKIRLKGEETGLEREGITFDYAYTALNRNLKGNRFGASIGSNAFLGESVFSKRGRGRILSPSSSSSSPPLRSTALLPLAKLDFLSGFHDLKARGEIEGFPVSPREHRNDTSIRKKGSVVVRFHPPSLSLSLSLLPIDRSIPLRDSALSFVYTQISAPPNSPELGELVAPWASDDEYRVYRDRGFSREKRNLFLFRPSGEHGIFFLNRNFHPFEFTTETWIN